MYRDRTPPCALVVILLLAAACGDPSGPTGDSYARRFESLWQRFDATYSYFEYKHIDWDAAHREYLPRAQAARTQDELTSLLLEMLAPLRDVHVALYRPDGSTIPTYVPAYALNWDRETWLAYTAVAGWHQESGTSWGWGRFGDVGFLVIGDWSPQRVSAGGIDAALDSLRETHALIIDVRPNPGGDDSIALAVAGRFAAATTIGGYVQFRDGPAHDDFGPLLAKTVSPRGPWRYANPVFLLVGRGVFSSDEQFVAAMRELPQVRVLGDTTGGGTGNPGVYDLGDGWGYSVSRWIGYTAELEVIEWNGIAPDEVVPWSPQDFARHYDPVLERALVEAQGGGASIVARSGDASGG